MTSSSSSPALVLRHIFGLNSNVSSNINHIDDSIVAYPAGDQVVLYNSESRSQRFIHFSSGADAEDSGMSAMAVSPKDHKYIAVAEKGDRAVVTVYNSHTLKRVRTPLQSSECASNAFVSVCFSPDQRYMLTQGGAPDYLLINWFWEKNRPLQSVKLGSTGANVRVVAASYCPSNPTLIAVIGSNVLRFFHIEQSELKLQPSSLREKKDSQELLCMAWDNERLLIGSEDGDIYVFEGSEHRRTCATPGEAVPVHALAVYSKGFVCGCSDGVLHVFERIEDKDRDEQEREWYRPYKTFRVEGFISSISSLSVSPNGDVLALTLDSSQAFTLNLSQIDIFKQEDMNFESLAQEFHSAAVVDIDVCTRKPLIASCSMDASVRVWNYEERTCEIASNFDESPLSISFHPSGLHVLVGFPDRLSLMNVLMDDIRSFKDFAIKDCRESAFSNGGQYFAAASGSSVSVYATFSGENLVNLRGHSGKVRSICWNKDDSGLISAGVDGVVMEWEMPSGNRIRNVEQRSCSFVGAAQSVDQHVFVVSNDSVIREIFEGKVQTTLELDVNVSQLTTRGGASCSCMYAGAASGAICSFKMPLDANFESFSVHNAPINALCLSIDETMLFAASEDGAISVMEVRDAKDAKHSAAAKRDKREMPWAEEILVCKADLKERITLMKELSDKVEELTLHNEYQMRLKEMNYQDQIRGLNEKYTNELKADRQKFEMLQDEKEALNARFRRKIEEIRTRQSKELRELELYHGHKVDAESERYRELQNLLSSQQKRRLDDERKRSTANDNELHDLQQEYRVRIEKERQVCLRTEAEKRAIVDEFEETKKVLEDDADREIDELKEVYDAKLAAERKLTLRLGGNNGVLKAKFAKMQTRIKEQRLQIEKMVDDEKRLYDAIRGLEKDIEGYQKEISERDSTIADKDKRIHDLRKKNQELEKFKFVLDYKIRELNRQIRPREIEIERKRKQLKEMNEEVHRYKSEHAALGLGVKELKLKLNGMCDEVARMSERLARLKGSVQRFCNDVQFLALELADNKKLKKGVIRLYQAQKNDAGDGVTTSTEETRSDPTKEYQRHRVYLERTVDSLWDKMGKDARIHKKDNLRIMQENITLIAEINELRRDIRYTKDLQERANNLPKEGDVEKEVQKQKSEISQLKKKIEELQTRQRRLPPGSASRGIRPHPRDEFTPREQDI